MVPVFVGVLAPAGERASLGRPLDLSVIVGLIVVLAVIYLVVRRYAGAGLKRI